MNERHSTPEQVFNTFEYYSMQSTAVLSELSGDRVETREVQLTESKSAITQSILAQAGVMPPETVSIIWQSEYPSIALDEIIPGTESVILNLNYESNISRVYIIVREHDGTYTYSKHDHFDYGQETHPLLKNRDDSTVISPFEWGAISRIADELKS